MPDDEVLYDLADLFKVFADDHVNTILAQGNRDQPARMA